MIRCGVLTISDRSFRGERTDTSGPVLVQALTGKGWPVIVTGLIPDDQPAIEKTLREWVDRGDIDLILTTGGTGFSPRDVTPEATRKIVSRPAPGLGEAMRAASLLKTPHGMLSRAEAGISAETLIINLPGSPRAAEENLLTVIEVLHHAVELIRGDPGAEKGHTAHSSGRHSEP
jgi:molybdenum cofactor synthesis domain-containing protein